MTRRLTLPTDSKVRKDIPLYSGCYTYFPAALAGVALHSKAGNDKHNPGEPLHHARGKSMDHADCIARHSMDIADFLAHRVVWTQEEQDAILTEANAMSWRALALSQELHEKFGAPLAPAARLPKEATTSPKMCPTLSCKFTADKKHECVDKYGQPLRWVSDPAAKAPVAECFDFPASVPTPILYGQKLAPNHAWSHDPSPEPELAPLQPYVPPHLG